MIIGALAPESCEPLAIRLSAAACALALSLVFVVTRPHALDAIGDGPSLLAMLVALLSLAGASSLGFFSLALRSAARIGEPVAHVYCAGITETISQLLAVSLTQSSVCPVGFKACTLSSLVVAVTLVLFARYPKIEQQRPQLVHVPDVDSAAARPAEQPFAPSI